MIEQRIILITRDLFLNDPVIQGLFAPEDVKVYFLLGDVTPDFPHIIHCAKVKSDGVDPVFFGNYTVDVLDHTQDCSRIMAVAHRIAVLLNQRVDVEGGGGLRFFFRDRQTYTTDQWVKRVSLLFGFRGVDTEFVSDTLSLQ